MIDLRSGGIRVVSLHSYLELSTRYLAVLVRVEKVKELVDLLFKGLLKVWVEGAKSILYGLLYTINAQAEFINCQHAILVCVQSVKEKLQIVRESQPLDIELFSEESYKLQLFQYSVPV